MNRNYLRCKTELFAEKIILTGLLKNAQVQGARIPESGVATNKERLLPRRRVGEPAGGVL